jgi:hypothetical protein
LSRPADRNHFIDADPGADRPRSHVDIAMGPVATRCAAEQVRMKSAAFP